MAWPVGQNNFLFSRCSRDKLGVKVPKIVLLPLYVTSILKPKWHLEKLAEKMRRTLFGVMIGSEETVKAFRQTKYLFVRSPHTLISWGLFSSFRLNVVIVIYLVLFS
jgi:hypothetical protein